MDVIASPVCGSLLALFRGALCAFGDDDFKRVAEPCVGLGGLRELFRVVKVRYTQTSAFEHDVRLVPFYKKMTEVDLEHKSHHIIWKGLTEVDITTIDDAEGLVSGPPCTPWAKNGSKQGRRDGRSEVMWTVVLMIIELAWRGVLTWFCIENSPEARPWMEEIMGIFHSAIPFFAVELRIAELRHTWPAKRERAWLRGCRWDICVGIVPPPLPLTDDCVVGLDDILDDSLPNVFKEDLSTRRKKHNYEHFIRLIIADMDRRASTNVGRISAWSGALSPSTTAH